MKFLIVKPMSNPIRNQLFAHNNHVTIALAAQLVWKIGFVAFGSLVLGKTMDVFTLSAACIAPSGTMKANKQGGSFVII